MNLRDGKFYAVNGGTHFGEGHLLTTIQRIGQGKMLKKKSNG